MLLGAYICLYYIRLQCLKPCNEVLGIIIVQRKSKRVYDVRFLLHEIMIIPELSLVIVLTRWDIVNADRLAHVILLDWIKQ